MLCYVMLCYTSDFAPGVHVPFTTVRAQGLARKFCVRKFSRLVTKLLCKKNRKCMCKYTQGEVTSQNLWPRYDRHFVGITWHNVWS